MSQIVCPPELMEKFSNFIQDKRAIRMLMEGIAGCGKSTQVAFNLMAVYREQFPNHSVVVLAPTHSAVRELRDKFRAAGMALGVRFMTLHKYTGLVPVTDDGAIHSGLLRRVKKYGEALQANLLVIDEYGMIDKAISAQIDELIAQRIVDKLLFMGDEKQLRNPGLLPNEQPPISVAKREKYHHLFPETYRARGEDVRNHVYALYDKVAQGKGEGLRYELSESQNVHYSPLPTFEGFDVSQSRLLAYRHNTVQAMNAIVLGRSAMQRGDITFSRMTKQFYRVETIMSNYDYVELPGIRTLERVRQNPGYDPAEYDTLYTDESDRYNTRAFCAGLRGVQLVVLQPVIPEIGGEWSDVEDTSPECWFALYGSGNHKDAVKAAQKEGLRLNAELCGKFNLPPDRVLDFCKDNWDREEVRERKQAWRRFFAYDRTVLCLDAPFACTVHSAQGATYENVYLAHDDLKFAKAFNADDTYARLLYVGVSRTAGTLHIVNGS